MHPASIGPYQIQRELGRGGMGEVFLARDTRLDRSVAIKALPAHLAQDPDRLARFQREAKVLASLNHPNIAAIYGLEEAAGHQYLILEFVEGETLVDRLARGAIPIDEAIQLAKQIAEALEVAHEKGIVHRDLKPANVMATPEGAVKVLDFGLARTADAALPAPGNVQPDSPTVPSPPPVNSPTIPGAIMGTAGYMSPEQARGKPVDKRSDIFSFGCVLYEMLAGVGPFPGETVTDSLGAILHREPDWTRLPAATPPRIRELLASCLVKDRKDRLHDIADARLAIQHAGGTIAEPSRSTSKNTLPWMILAASFALLAAAVVWMQRGGKPSAPSSASVVRSTIEITPGALIAGGDGPVALSPDGRTLAFVAGGPGETPRIWIRPLDSLSAQPLQGTENATYPFWSPDGRNLGYFSRGKLRRIPAAGGTPVALADVEEPRGGTWGTSGAIVFAPGPYNPLMSIPATGGTPVAITKLGNQHEGKQTHRLPCFLPDGKHVLYTSSANMHSEESSTIKLLNLESGADGKSVSLVNARSLALFAPPNYLLFVRNAALMAQRLDVAAEKVVGEPVVLAEHVSLNPDRFAAPLSVSCGAEPGGGLLVYRSSQSPAQLEWFDADGRSQGTVGEPAIFRNLDISRDGDRATAVIRRDDGQMDLWIVDTARGTRVLLVQHVSSNSAYWCPASVGARNITYWDTSDRSHLRETEGNMTDTVLTEGFVNDWSRDGKTLTIVRQTRETNTDIYLMDAATKQVRPYLVTTDWEEFGAFSPDGSWIAFISTRSGKMELFVAPITNSSAARPIAPFDRGGYLSWLDDGSILYSDPTGAKLFTVTTKINEGKIELGKPTPAFGGMGVPDTFAVSRDGKRMLAAVPINKSSKESLVLIQNWQTMLSTPP